MMSQSQLHRWFIGSLLASVAIGFYAIAVLVMHPVCLQLGYIATGLMAFAVYMIFFVKDTDDSGVPSLSICVAIVWPLFWAIGAAQLIFWLWRLSKRLRAKLRDKLEELLIVLWVRWQLRHYR